MSLKRKRVVLSLRDKVDVIESLLKGESGSSLARKYGVGSATISDIKKNSESILKFVSLLDNEEGSLNKKTMKTAENINLDSAVYAWYFHKKSQGDPISGPMICEKALELNKEINGDPEFKASTGWLTRSKIRHNIRFQEEAVPAEPSVAKATVENRLALLPEDEGNLLPQETDSSLCLNALLGLKAEYDCGKDILQASGAMRTSNRFINLLDQIRSQQLTTGKKVPRPVSYNDSGTEAHLELTHEDGSGPAMFTDEFVVEAQDSDEDNTVSTELMNRIRSGPSVESCPVPVKIEYDPDQHTPEVQEVLELDYPEPAEVVTPEPAEVVTPEPTEVVTPEPSRKPLKQKSVRKRKATVKQIEEILTRVLDNTIHKFMAFEEALDKRAREETSSFRNKLLAIERRKLEESTNQTIQNERIINLMESMLSQRQ